MTRTKFLSLLSVSAAAHVNPSSKWLSPLRALAGFFVWVLLFGIGTLAPLPSYAATACGGDGERACCVAERIPSCNQGLREVGGCTGDCKCGGLNPLGIANSIGHCEAPPPPPTIAPCGSAGQRACCVAERIPSCNQGLREVGGCTGNCLCGGPNPGGLLKSIGQCAALTITSCGGAGQRACCVTERIPSCNQGLIEVGGCTGNCACGGPNPTGTLVSIGHCNAPPQPTISNCGGIGQRACCVGERIPSCNQGLIEVAGCRTGDCKCGGPNPGGLLNSIGQCAAPKPGPSITSCGGIGQRACCVTERIPSCNQGLKEVGGCTGNCMCGGANALNSLGHCEGDCPTAKNNLTTLNDRLTKLNIEIAAANQTVQQQCAQQVVPTTMKQAVGGLPAKSVAPSGLQRPLIK